MRQGAQGQSVQPRGESTKDGQSRGQKDEGVKSERERDQDPEENTVSSLSFRSISLNIFLQ